MCGRQYSTVNCCTIQEVLELLFVDVRKIHFKLAESEVLLVIQASQEIPRINAGYTFYVPKVNLHVGIFTLLIEWVRTGYDTYEVGWS